MIAINLTTGIYPNTQIPLDAKCYFKSLAEMEDLGTSNFRAFAYYDKMEVICIENETKYMWRERTDQNENAIIEEDFVYPNNTIVDGIDYSNKSYNFFVYNTPQVNQNTENIEYLLGNDRIRMGSVFWTDGLNFKSTIVKYSLGLEIKTIDPLALTIDAIGTPSLKRRDVFAVNKETNTIDIIKGQEAVTALEPTIVFPYHLRIGDVLIDENGIVGSSVEIIWDEDLGEPTEWTTTKTQTEGAMMQGYLPNDPPSGVKTLFTRSVGNGDKWIFTNDVLINKNDFSSLNLFLQNKLASAFYVPYRLEIRFKNQNTLCAVFNIVNFSYGFDQSITAFQTIDIPLATSIIGWQNDQFDIIEVVFKTVNPNDLTLKDDIISIDDIKLLGGTNTPNITSNSWLGLIDTYESNFILKGGYQSRVRQQQDGLELVHPVLFPMNGQFMVRKDVMNGKTNLKTLEIGDEVYFKKISNNGNPMTLIGHTYLGGDQELRESYQQNQTIDI